MNLSEDDFYNLRDRINDAATAFLRSAHDAGDNEELRLKPMVVSVVECFRQSHLSETDEKVVREWASGLYEGMAILAILFSGCADLVIENGKVAGVSVDQLVVEAKRINNARRQR